MSTPVSIHDGPFTTNTLVSKVFLILYIFIIWISFLPLILEFYLFWKLIENHLIFFFLIFPIEIYIGYLILVFSSALAAKFFLLITNIILEPKEGVFERKKSARDYYFWSLRAVIKKWPIWISKFMPLPIIDKIILRWFHNDSDFIEIADNAILGEGSIIMSSIVIGDSLLVKKVVLHNGCTIGAFSVIAPGTIVEEGAILGMGSYTNINQQLEKKTIYYGRPAKKLKKTDNSFIYTKN